MNWESILKSIASITSVFKPNESIVRERAEKRDIKNETRKKRHELKRLRIQKKIDRRTKKK